MTILLGCDPEVFMKKDGQFVSAHNMVKGTKKRPFKVDKGAVQVDGLALEFNIDPAASENEFCINIQTVFAALRDMVPEHELSISPVAHFEEAYFKAQPEEALELGCDPDYDAYTGEPNVKPSTDKPMRTAAGHVHIGWGEGLSGDGHFEMCRDVIKQMDFYLGLPSLVYDDSSERRQLYGAAGAFRTKPYGCEYRTLSNKWLDNEQLIKWVWRAAQQGWEDWLNGKRPYEDMDVRSIINSSDVNAAVSLCKQLSIEIPYAH